MVELLRLYPGKGEKFKSVSQEEFNAPMHIAREYKGWGVLSTIETGLDIYDPRGNQVARKKWPSRSYVRNMGRIMRNLFFEASPVQYTDISGTSRAAGDRENAAADGGLLPRCPTDDGVVDIGFDTAPWSGAGMAIGDGVASEVHNRDDLVGRSGEIAEARRFVYTTALTTSTITLEITGAITNRLSSTVNVTEVGLYINARGGAGFIDVMGFWLLLAYDGVGSTAVAQGGVAAPRYTLNFPV